MTDRAEHSPGPWRELDDLSIGDAAGVTVAVIYHGSEGNKVGNRQLVTAGPEMLDLLKRAARGDDVKDAVIALVARIEKPGGRLNV